VLAKEDRITSFLMEPPDPQRTANSQLARAILGGQSRGFIYIIQRLHDADFDPCIKYRICRLPRLSYFLAIDRFLPRQFAQRGDRLRLSNGIIFLGLVSALLVIIFHAREQSLLPLYAVEMLYVVHHFAI
jgi:hypothetical protein